MDMTHLRKQVRSAGLSLKGSKGKYIVRSPAEFNKVKGHLVFPCSVVQTFNNLVDVETWFNAQHNQPVKILKS